METGAFEAPRVGKRTPYDKGGNLVPYSQGEWVRFAGNAATKDGTLVAGLTNEVARTGRQSLYVEFRHQTAQNAAIELASRLVRIKSDAQYHVAIWGRTDAKNPLTIDQRIPLLRVEIDFFQADQQTQTGTSIIQLQPIPGTPNLPPLFPTTRWGEFYVNAKAPADAAYIRVTWAWISSADKGETTGVAYFDDATIEGEKPPPEPVAAEPEPTAAPAAPVKPSEAAPAAATPVPLKRKNG
jgi:hypothetical protein